MDVGLHIYNGYLPLLLVVITAFLIACVMLWLNHILGQIVREKTPKKYDTYECGVPYEGSAHQQFSVRYYLIGIIFLVFDVEVVFMYPWALIYKKMAQVNMFVVFEMLVFLAILIVGYIYLRLSKALEWD